jgi:hypothetical protein
VVLMNDIDPSVPSGPIAYTADQRANWEASIARMDRLQARLDEGPFIRLAGGQMRGKLLLNADPLDLTEAATKRYVDVLIGIGGPYMPDAPADDLAYGRCNADWTSVLPLTGGRLTGPLLLAADPTLAGHAATKRYVDARVSNIQEAPIDGGAYGRQNGFWLEVLATTGGNLGGPLVLATDPATDLEAVTKRYVDARVSAIPEAPTDGAFYGRASGAWGRVLGLAGGRMAGDLMLASDPLDASQAATKRYVDAQFSGGGLPDAPVDGVLYGRQDAAWAPVPPPGTGGGGIPDAPADGVLYGRLDAAWAPVPPPGTGGGIPEAPADGMLYGRQDYAWAQIPPGMLIEPIGPGTWGRMATGAWSRAVSLAGDTMTGLLTLPNLTVMNSGAGAGFVLAPTGVARGEVIIAPQLGATPLWRIGTTALGSFGVRGNAEWLTIDEATGVMTLSGAITATGLISAATPATQPEHLINKAYADALDPGLPDAPSDGIVYGRLNGAWANMNWGIVNPGGGGTFGRTETGDWERAVALAGDTMTGPLQVPDGTASRCALGVGEAITGFYRIPAQGLVAAHESVGVMLFNRTGSILATTLNMSGYRITNLDAPTAPGDAASKGYVDAHGPDLPTLDARYLQLSGGTIDGAIGFAGLSQGLTWQQSMAAFYTDGPLVLRQTVGNPGVMIEDNSGTTSTRRRVLVTGDALTQADADARYLQPIGGDARYLQLTGGSLFGPLQLPSGSLAAPALALGNPTTGLMSAGNALIVAVSGNLMWQWTTTLAMANTPLTMVGNRIQNVGAPTLATDAVPRQYVDDAVAAVAAPSAFRTIVYMPNEFTLTNTGVTFLDINFPMPATGIRNILLTVDPVFASGDAAGTLWELLYATNLILIEAPMIAYKFSNTTTAMFRGVAKLTAAVDASPGTVRVLLNARVTAGPATLVQVGAGGTVAPTMRTLVSIQDLGPA